MEQTERKSILYMEDDPGIALLVTRHLESKGYRVEIAGDGESGISRCTDEQYDIIAVDQSMPGMDGLHVIRYLIENHIRVPIIMITGTGDVNIAVEAMKLGAVDYVVKDSSANFIQRLPAVLEKVLNQWYLKVEKENAEKALHTAFQRIKKDHDDFVSVVNMLRMGILSVDPDEHITFANKAAVDLTGKSLSNLIGQSYLTVLRMDNPDELKNLFTRPRSDSTKLRTRVTFEKNRQAWLDIEIQDDPRNPDLRILFLYDMSEIYDLRILLTKQATFHDLVGRSQIMQSIYQRIQDIATVDWTVLIEGDTGTGKELVARAIHSCSHRKDQPFIAVNCAGLTDSLLTSQLFGHRRGAFTGAVNDHKGFFEVANGGTLFLDEIGDISHSMQTTLLRVLEMKEITRLGESKPRKVDIRILTATHRNLSDDVTAGRFRSDLLYRLRIARIQLPTLAARREDIPLLAQTFLGLSRAATGKSVESIRDETMAAFLDYDWPGNVRELKSAVDFATLHCRSSSIGLDDLPPEITGDNALSGRNTLPIINEKEQLLAALTSTGGKRSAAAKLMGMSRATFYRRLTRYGIT
jgi:DNA-binding NtrC family response regulator